MPSNLKRRLAIGVTAVAVAAFAGGAYAATRDSAANARQAFLNDVAKRLHVTPTQLSAALQGAAIDQVDAAAAAGRLTQAQANALKQRITKGGTVPLPAGPGLGGPGPRLFGPPSRFGGPPGSPVPRPFGAPGPRLFGAPAAPGAIAHHTGPLAAAASYLGISERQLFSQLGTGKALAQIANSRGKSVAGLKSAITASIKATLDKAVAAKMITSAQEQQILSRLSGALGDAINQAGPGFAFRVGPGFGNRAGPGFGFRVSPGFGNRAGLGFGLRGSGKAIPWRSAPSRTPSGPAAAAVAPQAGPVE